MKYRYDKKFKAYIGDAETVLEAVETLEDFLIADFGQKDWSPKFLRKHFKICKDEIRRIQAPVKMRGKNRRRIKGFKWV